MANKMQKEEECRNSVEELIERLQTRDRSNQLANRHIYMHESMTQYRPNIFVNHIQKFIIHQKIPLYRPSIYLSGHHVMMQTHQTFA